MEELKNELDNKYNGCNYFRLKSEEANLDMEIYKGEFYRVNAMLHNLYGFDEQEVSDLVSMIRDPLPQIVFNNRENYVSLTPFMKLFTEDEAFRNLNFIFEQGPESFHLLYANVMASVKEGQTYFYMKCYNSRNRVEIYYNDRQTPVHYLGFSGRLDKFEKCLERELKDSEIIHASDGILRE